MTDLCPLCGGRITYRWVIDGSSGRRHGESERSFMDTKKGRVVSKDVEVTETIESEKFYTSTKVKRVGEDHVSPSFIGCVTENCFFYFEKMANRLNRIDNSTETRMDFKRRLNQFHEKCTKVKEGNGLNDDGGGSGSNEGVGDESETGDGFSGNGSGFRGEGK
ncbi:MAG: hypothetical protein ABEK59_02545 [Halobacteria archaeon]